MTDTREPEGLPSMFRSSYAIDREARNQVEADTHHEQEVVVLSLGRILPTMSP